MDVGSFGFFLVPFTPIESRKRAAEFGEGFLGRQIPVERALRSKAAYIPFPEFEIVFDLLWGKFRHRGGIELQEELGVETRVGSRVVHVKHAYSHFKLDMDVHWTWIEPGVPQTLGCTDIRWVTLAETAAFALSRADLKVIEALEETRLPDS